MKTVLLKVLSFLFAIQFQSIAQAAPAPVRTVDSVDIQKYLGKWYEFAAIPQDFEKQCVANATAEYGLAESGLFSVINSCNAASGQKNIAIGRAKIVDTSSNAKLKVTFVNAMGWQFALGGDYWILGLGANYSFAVVAGPSRDYAWILSRTSEMTAPQIKNANQILVDQGFDTCKLITTIQSGGLQFKTPLCQIATEE